MLKPSILCGGHVSLTVTLLTMITACAQPPLDQFKAAQEAIESARAAEAAEYASDDFAKLELEFEVAKKELAKPGKVFLLSHSFSDAENLLVKVIEDAEHVTANATRSKEMAKAAAVALEQEAKEVMTVVKKLISTSPSAREKASLEVAKQELQTNLTEVHRLIERSDYRGAQVHARSVKEKGMAVSQGIQQVVLPGTNVN